MEENRSITVNLTLDEVKHATHFAHERQKNAGRLGAKDKFFASDGVKLHIQGALAELAVCKALGIQWNPQIFEPEVFKHKELRELDVHSAEVRSTNYPSGRLILHPDDFDNAPFVFVISPSEQEHKLMGWLWAYEGKQRKYWVDENIRHPAFFVPQKSLRSIHQFLEMHRELEEALRTA